MLVWWCCSFLRQLRTSLETPTHGHGMKTDMAEPSVFRRSAVPAEAIGTRTRTVPQTLHGTAIYADQARGGGLGGLFGAAYIAVPWSVWGKKKRPWSGLSVGAAVVIVFRTRPTRPKTPNRLEEVRGDLHPQSRASWLAGFWGGQPV